MKKKLYIGIDMGGTTLKGGLVSSRGKIINQSACPISPRSRKSAIAKKVIRIAENLLNPNPACLGIGLGWPATVNIPLKGTAIKRVLERRFRLPVFLDNDANCFTLAEALFGSGKNYSIVVGITLGTGIGSGLTINKKIYRGQGEAPELGHTTLDFHGPKCECGNWGCFEKFVGKKGLVRLAKKYRLSQKEGLELYELARQKNQKALKVWQEMGVLLGIGVVNAINIFDPEIIVLGGKISKAWRFFSREMKKEIKKRALIKSCPVVMSTLKNSAVIGAALLVKQNLGQTKNSPL